MHESEIAALAEGMVPFVRECVSEAQKLPPELAEQVASAVRLLHESPPLEQRTASPQPAAPKVIRIERDEQSNFVPIYADN